MIILYRFHSSWSLKSSNNSRSSNSSDVLVPLILWKWERRGHCLFERGACLTSSPRGWVLVQGNAVFLIRQQWLPSLLLSFIHHIPSQTKFSFINFVPVCVHSDTLHLSINSHNLIQRIISLKLCDKLNYIMHFDKFLVMIYWKRGPYMMSELTTFCFLMYKTSRIHVAVGLHRNKSQMTSKCS